MNITKRMYPVVFTLSFLTLASFALAQAQAPYFEDSWEAPEAQPIE